MRVSPLNVDVILGPSIVGWKLILSISSNCVLTVINASAAVTLLEQRPEKWTQLLLMDKINFHPTILGPSITSTFKGLTRIRPLSCGFDSSVGRALHWHRRGRGFESRSEPEFFSGLCSSSVTAALALMTVGKEFQSSFSFLRHFVCPSSK